MPGPPPPTLSYDPIHGYIPFVSETSDPRATACEQDLIDHPWLQRLRQIHQLQTAWWVFPSAEHTRFQHVLGAMHLGSRFVDQLYPSLQEACPGLPSRGYVESLVRLAGLLHDVGHGPFGHFFDDHFLQQFSLTHELLGAQIITTDLAPLIEGIRENPDSRLLENEQLQADQVAWLIIRPSGDDACDQHGRRQHRRGGYGDQRDEHANCSGRGRAERGQRRHQPERREHPQQLGSSRGKRPAQPAERQRRRAAGRQHGDAGPAVLDAAPRPGQPLKHTAAHESDTASGGRLVSASR